MNSKPTYLKIGILISSLSFIFILGIICRFDSILHYIRPITVIQLPLPREVCALRHFNSKYEDFEERLCILQEGCKSSTVRNYRLSFSQSQEIYYMDQSANVSFCKVPKAGSSYLTRIYLTLKRSEWNQTRILDISRQEIHILGNKYGTKSADVINQFGGIKVLVVRDPYSRLYSAYVDKIFLGLHFQQKQNVFSRARLQRFCEEPIPFSDFLLNILREAEMGKKINRHWSPIYLLCHPCHVMYDVIAKQETLTRDVEYIIDSTNISSSKKTLVKALSRDQSLAQTVQSLLRTYFSKQRIWKKCRDKTEYFRRIWESLQIQGIMRDDLTFPTKPGSGSEDLNPRVLTETVLDFIQRFPINSTQKQKQRRDSLVKAYRSVPQSIIHQIQEVFYNDFVLFNYSLRPPLQA